MREIIKRYVLNEDVNVDKLISNYFSEGGFMKEIPSPKYSYGHYLIDEIEINIEIAVNSDGTLYFDDYDSIYIIDDTFGQPYYPFYNKDFENPFINKVIVKYNEFMDEFVKKGIFKEMVLEKEENNKELKK